MRALIGVLLVGCGGCFSYVRLDPSAPAPKRSTDVVARLVAPTDFPAGQVTVHGVIEVAGLLAYGDGDSLVIAARHVSAADGDSYAGYGGLITILRPNVATLEAKRASAWKTGIALGTGGAQVCPNQPVAIHRMQREPVRVDQEAENDAHPYQAGEQCRDLEISCAVQDLQQPGRIVPSPRQCARRVTR